ncbi:MAG: ABC transporter permease [Acidimicrobiia bacterium]|nr:ABC transporter permease [Acidimicrobiia bacterium]
MRALAFAWRSLVRQPARATLGILGVAAVGALLFDMLLLSQGLVRSMRDLLERQDFDVRVTATEALPGTGPVIDDAVAVVATIKALPSVREAVAFRIEDLSIDRAGRRRVRGFLQGVGRGAVQPWTLLRGGNPQGPRELVLDEDGAREAGVAVGSSITIRASCSAERDALPPVTFRVSGIAAFPFDGPDDVTAATTDDGLATACGEREAGMADMILVTAAGDPAAAAADIAAARPDLRAFTNEQMIGRIEQGGFTYFRQISTVLTTVTVSFALLLITVLLTVSVNQRLGEIAALRALGFSRARVVADVFSESVLIVGIGGALSLPLGFALAEGLDRILKRMPGIPEPLHFFVFQPEALAVHATLLVVTAVAAALYPMRIVARLPIAATLRDEVIS